MLLSVVYIAFAVSQFNICMVGCRPNAIVIVRRAFASFSLHATMSTRLFCAGTFPLAACSTNAGTGSSPVTISYYLPASKICRIWNFHMSYWVPSCNLSILYASLSVSSCENSLRNTQNHKFRPKTPARFTKKQIRPEIADRTHLVSPDEKKFVQKLRFDYTISPLFHPMTKSRKHDIRFLFLHFVQKNTESISQIFARKELHVARINFCPEIAQKISQNIARTWIRSTKKFVQKHPIRFHDFTGSFNVEMTTKKFFLRITKGFTVDRIFSVSRIDELQKFPETNFAILHYRMYCMFFSFVCLCYIPFHRPQNIQFISPDR